MLLVTLINALFVAGPLVAAHSGPDGNGRELSPVLKREFPTGRDTSTVPRPILGSVPYGVSLVTCTIPGQVALTFDDGPYIYTTELLDILAKNQVKATFFINANNHSGLISDIKNGYRNIVKRMFNEDHHIGSHSYSHKDLEAITSDERVAEIIDNEIAIADILGVFPTYFRPPFESCASACVTALAKYGYHITNYNLDTRDWEVDYHTADQYFVGNLSLGRPWSSSFIPIAHDIHQTTVESLAQLMIDESRRQGYNLTTVGGCLGDPKINWYRDAVTGQAWDGQPVPLDREDSAPSKDAPPAGSASATPPHPVQPTNATPPTNSPGAQFALAISVAVLVFLT